MATFTGGNAITGTDAIVHFPANAFSSSVGSFTPSTKIALLFPPLRRIAFESASLCGFIYLMVQLWKHL